MVFFLPDFTAWQRFVGAPMGEPDFMATFNLAASNQRVVLGLLPRKEIGSGLAALAFCPRVKVVSESMFYQFLRTTVNEVDTVTTMLQKPKNTVVSCEIRPLQVQPLSTPWTCSHCQRRGHTTLGRNV